MTIRASECFTAFVAKPSHAITPSSPTPRENLFCAKATVKVSAPGKSSVSSTVVIEVIVGVAVATAATAGINKIAVRDTQDGVYPITAQYPAACPVATMTSAASGIIFWGKKV